MPSRQAERSPAIQPREGARPPRAGRAYGGFVLIVGGECDGGPEDHDLAVVAFDDQRVMSGEAVACELESGRSAALESPTLGVDKLYPFD